MRLLKYSLQRFFSNTISIRQYSNPANENKKSDASTKALNGNHPSWQAGLNHTERMQFAVSYPDSANFEDVEFAIYRALGFLEMSEEFASLNKKEAYESAMSFVRAAIEIGMKLDTCPNEQLTQIKEFINAGKTASFIRKKMNLTDDIPKRNYSGVCLNKQ